MREKKAGGKKKTTKQQPKTFLQTCIAATDAPAEAGGWRPQTTLPHPSQPAVPPFPATFYGGDLLGIAAAGRAEEQGSTQALSEEPFACTHDCITGFVKTRLLWVSVTAEIQSLFTRPSRTDRA